MTFMKSVYRWLSVSLLLTVICIFPFHDANAGEPDWSKIEEAYIDLFYPGQTAYEWLVSPKHKGYKQIQGGKESCLICHQGEEESRGDALVTGKKLEDAPPPKGTPSMITLFYKTVYDKENLYMWFSWPGSEKADEGNITAINIMVGEVQKRSKVKTKVKHFNTLGCWITCHRDAKSMPYTVSANDVNANKYFKTIGLSEVTKYLPGTRTKLDSTGGWAEVKPKEELDNRMKEGKFVDLWRFVVDSSNPGGKFVDEYISTSRFMDKGQGELSGKAEYKDGSWTVVFKRKLKAGDPMEDKIIKTGRKNRYVVAISIHDNSASRRHYTAFSRTLHFNDPNADINVEKLR